MSRYMPNHHTRIDTKSFIILEESDLRIAFSLPGKNHEANQKRHQRPLKGSLVPEKSKYELVNGPLGLVNSQYNGNGYLFWS